MKKLCSLLSFVLIASILLIIASAAGGDASDPLVSRDFLSGSFLSDILSSADRKLDTSDNTLHTPGCSVLGGIHNLG